MTDEWDEETGFDPLDERVSEMQLCLCGRDPDSAEVRAEMVKAMALSLRYGLVFGGCLWQAAEAFDTLFVSLLPGEARELEQMLQEIDTTYAERIAESVVPEDIEPNKARLH